ncbi:MAG: hypothetical protein EXR77_15635 [Myxococcales bacterium]|nr:hypothetical protein [Myxococcales bacterium]
MQPPLLLVLTSPEPIGPNRRLRPVVLCSLLALFSAAAIACSGPAVQAIETIDVPPIAASDDLIVVSWTGTWRTNWGVLDMVQDGPKILGSFTYLWENEERVGILIGVPKGNYLDFKWSEQKGNDKGQGRFVISANHAKFSGSFGYDASVDDGGMWSGLRNDDTILGY